MTGLDPASHLGEPSRPIVLDPGAGAALRFNGWRLANRELEEDEGSAGVYLAEDGRTFVLVRGLDGESVLSAVASRSDVHDLVRRLSDNINFHGTVSEVAAAVGEAERLWPPLAARLSGGEGERG